MLHLRSTSTSTMNSERASTTNQSMSSAQTSTMSSPYYKRTQPSISEEYQEHQEHQDSQNSPDLMNTEFYSSDIHDHTQHANTLRKSMVYSDSFDSTKFQQVRDSIFIDNENNIATVPSASNQEITKLAMTNSPSFSALASILENKTTHSTSFVKKPTSNLQNSTIAEEIPYYHEQVDPIDQNSPNLIQLDDQTPNLSIPKDSSFNSIMDSPTTHQLTSPQSYNNDVDIFKTPELPQLHTFHNSSSLSQISSKNSPLKESEESINDHSEIPEIISTPQIYKTSSFENHIKTPPPVILPKNRKNILNSPQYKQRSSSLPVLARPNEDIKPVEIPKKKKNKFISFFKSNKRSVSTSQVETKKQPQQAQQPIPNFPTSISSHRLPKKSTSTASLFDAFKKNKNKKQSQSQSSPIISSSKSTNDLPNITVNSNFKQIDNDDIQDVDDSFSISTTNSKEFNEDFNKLNISKPRPSSQISQKGEDVFPKSLNAQEVESIVSIERNRSVRSRHSTMSQQKPFSLTEAINSNAKEEGMYVTYADKELSIPDLTKSPTNSVLKNSTSISSFNKINNNDEFGDFAEDFATALEFDDIADNYNAENYNQDNDNNNNNIEDVSNFMEFADFIDFGEELQLNFDLDQSSSSPNMKSLRPPSLPGSSHSSPKLQPPLSIKPFNSTATTTAPESPLLESPILQSEPFQNLSTSTSYDHVSPALKPLPTFIHDQTSRPMSMSFKGLKAPAFTNHQSRPTLSSSSSFVSDVSRASKNQNRKVVFSSKILLYDAWNEEDYDRHPDVATCNQLTPMIAQRIKEELNELKSEMEVHEDSMCYTHFY